MCPEYGTYHTRLPERGQGFTSKKDPEFRPTNAITEVNYITFHLTSYRERSTYL